MAPPTRSSFPLLLSVLLALPLAGCGGGERPLLVFGAASLADALEEAGEVWREGHPERPVAFNFAGSNELARQIAAGAPADLFVAADRERLNAAHRILPDAAVPLLSNSLVVIAPRGRGAAVRSAEDLLAFERIGLPDPEAVPAGVYARRWLEAEGVWTDLAGRVVPALDARANLAAVASGALPAGIVYATDAAASDRVEMAHAVAGGPRIVYWAAPVEGGDRAAAAEFLAFLRGTPAGEVFRRHGFEHLPSEGPPPGAAGAPGPEPDA